MMFTFLFSPYGRVSRKSFWLEWILPYFLISIAVLLLDYATFPVNPETGEPQPVFQLIATLILFWPSIAITTKRLHDRGMTGWWQIAPFFAILALAAASYWYYTARMAADYGVPADRLAPGVDFGPIGAIVIVVLFAAAMWLFLYPLVNTLFLRGQSGPNQYGDDPLSENTAEVFA